MNTMHFCWLLLESLSPAEQLFKHPYTVFVQNIKQFKECFWHKSSHRIIFEMTEKPVLCYDMRWCAAYDKAFEMNNFWDSQLKDDPEFINN